MHNFSIQATGANSKDTVFWPVPERVICSEKVEFTSVKIEKLIQFLKESGPLAVHGYFKPNYFEFIPIDFQNKNIAWVNGALDQSDFKIQAIVIGVLEVYNNKVVYYLMSRSNYVHANLKVTEHYPVDSHFVYACDFQTFSNCLVALRPAIVLHDDELKFILHARATFNIQEFEYLKLLAIGKLDSSPECKRLSRELGEAIFKYSKDMNHGHTSTALGAILNFCDAVGFFVRDGFNRRKYFEKVWEGIGDEEGHLSFLPPESVWAL